MHGLPSPSGGANISASIVSPALAQVDGAQAKGTPPLPLPSAAPAPALSPLLLRLDPEPPPLALPEDSSPPSDTPPVVADPAPSALPNASVLRTTVRRAVALHRAHLQSIAHQEIWMVMVNGEGTITGSSRLWKGGLARLDLDLPDLVAQARMLEACGFILVQNRPGSLDKGLPIDVDLSLRVDLLGTLLGIPLFEHAYIDTQGETLFVREQGMLKETALVCRTLGERLSRAALREQSRWERECAERRAARANEAASGAEVIAPSSAAKRPPQT